MSDVRNTQQNTRKNKPKRPSLRERIRYYRRRPTSIYFLLWASFSALAIFLLALLGITQRMMLERSMKDEAASNVSAKGPKIEKQIENGPPPAFNGSYDLYLRVLALENNVDVLILGEDGTLYIRRKKNTAMQTLTLTDISTSKMKWSE